MIIVALGLSFQIPAIVFVLSRIGLVNARFLIAKLKYAVFASFAQAVPLGVRRSL
jgi:Sec-independent protein secretion pathway component TatC